MTANGHGWLTENLPTAGETNCLIWPFSCCTAGYGHFMVNRQRHLAHRFVCEIANGPPPTQLHEAAHSCGNRRCVNPKHLSWKTRQENQLDRNGHGTKTPPGRTKLSRRQAAQIRALKGIETSIDTAARYGVTESNVRLIQDGKIWKEVGRKHAMMLLPEQVIAVRNADPSKSDQEVSNELGIHRETVWRIRIGRSYRNVL